MSLFKDSGNASLPGLLQAARGFFRTAEEITRMVNEAAPAPTSTERTNPSA